MPYSYYDYVVNYYEEYYESHYDDLFNKTLCNTSHPSSSIFNTTNCHEYNYEYPIWWYPHINSLIPVILSLTALCALISIAICVVFFHQICKATQANHYQSSNKCIIIMLSSCCVVSHVAYNVAQIVVYYFYFLDFEWYRWLSMQIGWIFCWGFSKILLYSLFAYKYYELANTPMYKAPSKTSRRITMFCIISGLLSQVVLTILFNVYYFEYMDMEWFDDDEAHKRRQVLNANLIIMGIDVFLICLVGSLIFRSVLQLMTVVNAERTNPINVDHELSASQQDMIERTTRIALTCIVSLSSTIIIQLVWLISQETEDWDLYYVTYLWSVDNVINMFCIYFSMDFAKKHYQKVCCGCHKCFLCCIMRLVDTAPKTENKSAPTEPKPVAFPQVPLVDLDTTVGQHSDQI
eukprot:150880_1